MSLISLWVTATFNCIQMYSVLFFLPTNQQFVASSDGQASSCQNCLGPPHLWEAQHVPKGLLEKMGATACDGQHLGHLHHKMFAKHNGIMDVIIVQSHVCLLAFK